MSMLELKAVSKVYRTGTFGGDLLPALRQVSFAIDKGEVVSLIGQSGSGKSTLAKLILGLSKPSAGSISFEGSELSSRRREDMRDYYRHVQGVFQDPFSSYNPLYKADRALEMVRSVYFRDVHGEQWQRRLEAALEAVSLNPADVLNKFPHQLSGGQQQRMLIARALLLDVQLLVADEIISMLDASTRVDVLNLLVELKRKGLGILFITHDLSLGNYISDRTVILRNGAVVEMGDTRKVFGDPQHPYTRSLLSAVPQLHRKWEEGTNGSSAGGTGAGSTSVGSTSAGSTSVGSTSVGSTSVGSTSAGSTSAGPLVHSEHGAVEGENKRYSKSSLHPRSAARSQLADASDLHERGPRRSLMEGGGPAWRRRFSFGTPDEAAVLAAAQAPELAEYEEGHFVAVGG